MRLKAKILNLYFIDMTKCKFIVWVQIYCTPIAVAFSLTQKYCNLYLTKGPISISFHCLCWLYAKILSIPQPMSALDQRELKISLPRSQFPKPRLRCKNVALQNSHDLQKRKNIAICNIFALSWFHSEKGAEASNKHMQVQKYCHFLDF